VDEAWKKTGVTRYIARAKVITGPRAEKDPATYQIEHPLAKSGDDTRIDRLAIEIEGRTEEIDMANKRLVPPPAVQKILDEAKETLPSWYLDSTEKIVKRYYKGLDGDVILPGVDKEKFNEDEYKK
jgi:hypothetical protein